VTLAQRTDQEPELAVDDHGFKVKDKALFDKLAVGNQVEVEIVKDGRDTSSRRSSRPQWTHTKQT